MNKKKQKINRINDVNYLNTGLGYDLSLSWDDYKYTIPKRDYCDMDRNESFRNIGQFFHEFWFIQEFETYE